MLVRCKLEPSLKKWQLNPEKKKYWTRLGQRLVGRVGLIICSERNAGLITPPYVDFVVDPSFYDSDQITSKEYIILKYPPKAEHFFKIHSAYNCEINNKYFEFDYNEEFCVGNCYGGKCRRWRDDDNCFACFGTSVFLKERKNYNKYKTIYAKPLIYTIRDTKEDKEIMKTEINPSLLKEFIDKANLPYKISAWQDNTLLSVDYPSDFSEENVTKNEHKVIPFYDISHKEMPNKIA